LFDNASSPVPSRERHCIIAHNRAVSIFSLLLISSVVGYEAIINGL
jgi:hypothetical protein